MKLLDSLLERTNQFQRRHGSLGFPYAVIKKYGEDEAGYQAALLTYYGFLSLFPLLILLTTVAGIVARGNPQLHHQLLHATDNYLPIIGNALESSVHGLKATGPALIVSFLFTLYGARGVANAFRHGINHIWHTPRDERPSFPLATVRSLSIIVVGGLGFLLAAVLSSLLTSGEHLLGIRILSTLVTLSIFFALFLFVMKLSLPFKVGFKNLWVGALAAAIGLVILQIVGGYVITHELTKLNGAYGNFALVLGILFWLYLQSQVFFYALEIDTVKAGRLWPRSLVGDELTLEDKRVYRRLAKSTRMHQQEHIKTRFGG